MNENEEWQNKSANTEQDGNKSEGREGYRAYSSDNNRMRGEARPRRPRFNASADRAYSSSNSYATGTSSSNNAPMNEGGFRPDGFGNSSRGNYGGGQRNNSYNRNNYGNDNGYGQRGGYSKSDDGNGDQNGYNNRGGYNNNRGGYNNNRGGGYNNNRGGGYNNNRGGGYNNNRGGYDNNGGYNNNRGGYNNNRGGYDNNGGYNNNRGGYNNNRGGGYNNNRGGGYNNNRGGGYNNNRGGGYNNNRGGGYNNNRGGGYDNNRYSMKKQIEYKEYLEDPNAPIRLNKFLANAGVCSRREADQFIQAGVVKVNGTVVTELGTKVQRTDQVHFHDQLVSIEKKVYVLLNKPKDYVTTSDDPQQRKTVMDLVKNCCRERIYPVGRLDRNTTGVLLFTNDGELASKLTHPKFLKQKIYHVFLDKNVTAADMKQIAEGITLEDGVIRADDINYAADNDKKQVGIEIHSGKNRIVRRIFESLGYRVLKLDRVMFAGLTKKGLKRGDWRFLTEQEVAMLHMGSFQ